MLVFLCCFCTWLVPFLIISFSFLPATPHWVVTCSLSSHSSADDLLKSDILDDDDEHDLGDQSNGDHIQARLSLDGDLVERDRRRQEELAASRPHG